MVDPKIITHGIFNVNSDNIRNIDNDWDNNSFELAKMPKNIALNAHFNQDVSWVDTGIIDEVLYLRQAKSRGTHVIRTREEVVDRYKQLDIVYQSIKENGYNSIKADGFINVVIGRDGSLYFAGTGWHRLWICQNLGLSEIPVRVIARHKTWENLKSEYYAGKMMNQEKIYFMKDHPDII